jgi:BirA family biotin operon repressor/biotin-[acetyl-CoA-carboxylase] ligase
LAGIKYCNSISALISIQGFGEEKYINMMILNKEHTMRYIFLDEVDSTNNEIKRLAEKGYEDMTVVSADSQTAGRGRLGHSWTSPKGTSIATSILIRPEKLDIKMTQLPRITILTAVAVLDAIEHATGLTAGIKWPNDVLLHDKKVCGILTELCFMPKDAFAHQSDYSILHKAGNKYIVIGIGINVTVRDFPDEIKDMATSMSIAMEQAGKSKEEIEKLSRRSIIENVWTNFSYYYHEFLKTGNLNFIKKKYESRLVNIGRMVKVEDPNGEYEAKALGIDYAGKLLIEVGEDEYRAIDSGEVHVRGLYGYV